MLTFIKKTWAYYQHSVLGRRLLMAILLVSTLGAFIATCVQLAMDYRQDKYLIHTDLESLQHTAANTLAYQLWMVNHQAVQNQLSDFLRLPHLNYAEIMENDGTLYRAGAPVAAQDLITRTFKLEYQHPFQPEKILLGTVRLESSTAEIKGRIFNRFFVILLTQGVKTFLVSVFTLIIFQALIAKHLQQIAEQARRVNYLTLRKPFVLDRDEGDDELTRLVAAINQMRLNLLTHMSLLEKNESVLSRENRQLRHVFDASPNALLLSDARGFLKNMNVRAKRIFNMDSDLEWQSQELCNVIPAVNGVLMKSAERLLVDVQSAGESIYGRRIAYKDKHGEMIELLADAVPIRDETTHALYVLMVFKERVSSNVTSA